MRFSICLEMIYPELDFLTRAARVQDAGFTAVEFWAWEGKDLEGLRKLPGQGVAITTFSGQRRGSLVSREDWEIYRTEVQAAIPIARSLGCERLMLLTEELLPDGSARATGPSLTPAQKRANVVRGLADLAPVAENAGITLLLEPLNIRVDHPGYFLDSAREGFAIVEEVGSSHIRLLYDIYHMEVMEPHSSPILLSHLPLVGHIHIADVPGRHEPGTGELDCLRILRAVADAGYAGAVGFEFSPRGGSDKALARILELRDRLRTSGCPVN